jgi:serine phosphatase RsbU (regulator of sigma subunit)
MGHGLQSAQLATVSVAAYRNARRAGRSLTGAAVAIDQGVLSAFGGEAFTTAVLAELDTDAGVLSWINVGHLEPLLLRHNHLVKQLSSEPNLPFGLGLSPARTFSIGSEHLQRGDAVLLYTDGVVEARSPSGELFGLERLVDLVTRNLAAELPPNETIRRTVRELLAHQQAQLRDDATLLLVHWSGETSPRLLP